jgi:hypothetical protein
MVKVKRDIEGSLYLDQGLTNRVPMAFLAQIKPKTNEWINGKRSL